MKIKGNILKAPENFYTTDTWKNIEQLNSAMYKSGITINEARELSNIGRK